MRFLPFLLLSIAASALAQQATPVAVPSAAGALAVTYLPANIVTAGGGFMTPSTKFAYVGYSHLAGAGTYLSAVQEYTMVHKVVQACTLAGLTKPQYQWKWLTVGATGLGGACASGALIANGQVFADQRFGKSHFGAVETYQRETTGLGKATFGFRWAE